jgi:SAM-dependent methyltransferase
VPILSDKLSPADAAVLETFVVPRYLTLFGELVLEMFIESDAGRIAHLGCRTGFPDRQLYERSDGSQIIGLDPSLSALELARNKATVLGDVPIEYRLAQGLPTELESGRYSHTLALHPIATDTERVALYGEMARLLCTGGQALIGMPLRGSFQEIADLLREYALKFDEGDFGKALDTAVASRPTIETLAEQFEDAGFEDVDVEIRQTELDFDSGRAFMEDPMSRLLILPEIRSWLDGIELARPFEYVREAIDKYWSESKLGLTLNVGCASARRAQ